MKEQLHSHPYQERTALNRLLLLIALFVRSPGIGYPDENDPTHKGEHHNALASVAAGLKQLSIDLDLEISAYSVPTVRKDLEFLRKCGVIEERMYRWGYYLGTGVFSPLELPIALQAIKDIGERLGDPRIANLYQKLAKRLRGLELSQEDFYPVRSQLNRGIVYTDPERMRERTVYRETLFERLSELETAIVTGRGIEIYYARAPYPTESSRHWQIYPLQLLYHDVAWYLICEEIDSGYLAAIRVDRLSSHLCQLPIPSRGKSAQLDRLKVVERLLKNGWGISLGSRAQQLQELNEGSSIEVKVRFFEAVIPFIREGEKRHPRQQIKLGEKTADGRLVFINYSVILPERSLDEFFRWVRRFGSQALVLAPERYVAEFRQEVLQLVSRYQI
jgi:predicted DNA-binding transcriptional regulator YafY